MPRSLRLSSIAFSMAARLAPISVAAAAVVWVCADCCATSGVAQGATAVRTTSEKVRNRREECFQIVIGVYSKRPGLLLLLIIRKADENGFEAGSADILSARACAAR